MMRCEWKKLLLRRKSFLLLLAFLALELAATLLFTQPYDWELENNRAVYESYLSQVEGPLTQEKRAYLEAEMERLNTVHLDLEQVKADYYNGEITEEEYRASFDALAAEDSLYTGFSKLYSQYIFVRESESRSFLYTGGWEVLLTDFEPDYLFLIALILVLTPIFCDEYACRMHEILLTQKRSAKAQVWVKIGVALILTAVLTALLQLFDLAYCWAAFGLPHGSFTLQSLYSFGNAAKEMTLWQAFWLQFLLKEIGYLYGAVIILFLSVLLKKFALTLTAGIAVLILPLLTVDSGDAFLKIPGPWALTIGSVYLKGGSAELSWAGMGLLLAGVAIILGAMVYAIRQRNTNWQMKKSPRSLRKGAAMLCAVVLLLTGCGKSEESEAIFNRSASESYETEEYIVTYTTLTVKATGESYDFPLSALEGEIVSCGRSIFGVGDTVYYLRYTTHQTDAGTGNISENRDLVKLDLTTMEETVVYQWNRKTDWFFGLLTLDYTPDSLGLLFIHDNDMYYTDDANPGVYRMNLLTGQTQIVLSDLDSADIAYDGSRMYYLDSYNRLVILDLDSGESQTVDEVVAKRFLLTAQGISFQNRRDEDAQYLWDGTTAQKISDATEPG